MGCSYILYFQSAILETAQIYLFLLRIICWVTHHSLHLANQYGLFLLLPHTSLKVLLVCLHHSKLFMLLMQVNVWHAISKTCVLLEETFFPT